MTVWICDSCDTNNAGADARCRRCQRLPGSASGSTQVVVAPITALPTETPRPRFVASRHAEPPRITLRPAPPPPRVPLPPVPAPPYRPPAPPPRVRAGGRGRFVFGLLGVAATWVVFTAAKSMSTDDDNAGSSAGPPATTATACPADVARFLPYPDAELVAAYTTERHEITLCRTPHGQVFYDGVYIGRPRSDQWHISLPASATPTGYVAVNGDTSYEVRGLEVIISQPGKAASSLALTRVSP